MLELVRRARRRILHNELLCQGANAVSAALAAVILLLIAGTQILSWYWALLLPAAAIVFALYRVRKRLPSLYVTAQTVDRRMDLTDSLSTAIFFESVDSAKRASPDLRRLQLAQAERMAQKVDVERAVPYIIPQTAYVAAALLLVASSVFALRYGLTERLDLKQPLARILQQSFGWGSPQEKARQDTRKSPDKGASDDALASSEEGDPNVSSDNGPQPDDAAENSASSQDSKSASKADKNSQNQAQQDSAEDQAEKAEDSNAEGKQDSASNPKNGQQKGNEAQSQGNQASNAAQSGQSLLSKMKEAMQNLMSSLQKSPEQNAANQNQNGKNGKSQQNEGKQQSAKGEKKSGAQSEDSQEQQAADGQEAQNAQGQATERADSALNNKQPGSGAGSRDGSKDVKLAEQLAAMGKITEIIGKRSQNVTGEATVDVQNTSQQLRTAYQERNAEHAQTGAEINRDEIPVALESYVAQYFERVRKQAKK